MEDKRKRAIASDPVKRQGNDEREDRFPYGGDREGAEEAKEVAGPKAVPPADSSGRGAAATIGAKSPTRRKQV